jgi:hypothetical protein
MSRRGAGRDSRRGFSEHQADLFSVDPAGYVREVLASHSWPDEGRFPVNHAGARVRSLLWSDLTSSESPVIVAGFSSIAALVDLVAD